MDSNQNEPAPKFDLGGNEGKLVIPDGDRDPIEIIIRPNPRVLANAEDDNYKPGEVLQFVFKTDVVNPYAVIVWIQRMLQFRANYLNDSFLESSVFVDVHFAVKHVGLSVNNHFFVLREGDDTVITFLERGADLSDLKGLAGELY